MNEFLKAKLENAPTSPGCYFWKDKYGNIIYVGKAKNIKKRIHQYFNGKHNQRISQLVKNIADVDFITVPNENDALVLENNLIKTNKPKYNVLLKENSNYPYIILTNEKDPRLIYTRNYLSFKGKAFGPFPSSQINAYEVYNLLQRIIPFRKCHSIPKKKCIYHDLGQCLAPCINKISSEEYNEWKKKVNDIFDNKTKDVINDLKQKELYAAENLDFEGAKYYLELQNSLKIINEKQVVEFANEIECDVVGYYCDENYVSIIIFNYVDGKLISKNEQLSPYYDEEIQDVISSYLVQYYSTNKIPKNLYVNLEENYLDNLRNFLDTKVQSTNKAKFDKIILIAIENAKRYLKDHRLKSENEFNRTIGACEELGKLLNIDYPTRIDMIDNANIFNQTPVSAVITYINGQKATKYYRKLNLDDVSEKSDYHYMISALKRRYKKENLSGGRPNILIVDGGKIQLRAAKKAFEELGIIDIYIMGLIKNDKHKTNGIITQDEKEINLDKTSPLYLFLANMQDEVHRFAITHYRKRRVKSQMHTFLDDIDGLGPKTLDKLLKIYPNVLALKDVNEETLSQIVGKKIAKAIKDKIEQEVK